jgi:hypothetical protein
VRKLGLSDWASIAEITGTIAVVVSLLFVAYSLERNTTALSGQYVNEMYDANREISQILLANPELASIIERGQTDFASFSDSETLQYEQFLTLHLDIWERAITRENEGLIDEQSVAGWHKYYGEFFRRHMTRELWEEMRWQWTDPELFQRVDSALSDENL